jgi:hypothetical protein
MGDGDVRREGRKALAQGLWRMNRAPLGVAMPPPDLEHLDRGGGAAAEAAGLIEQGGGAAGTGEGDHQQPGAEGEGFHQIDGVLKHLAVANRAGGAAVLLPESRAGKLEPTELISSGGNRLIGAASSAMEHRLHQAATGGAQEMGGDQLRRPGEITTTTGHDHQLTTSRQKE